MRLTSIILLGTSLVACMKNSSTDNTDTAESAVDSSEAVSAEGDLVTSSVDGADMTALVAATATDVAGRIAANAMTRWLPAGCATVVQSGAMVTITYANCSGPRGLVHITGELDLAITLALDGTISVHATATAFEVNAATLDIDATGTYTTSGTSHTLVVQSQGSGTGRLGNSVDHDGNYTVTWDSASECRSITGMWSTELSTPTASATRSNDVTLSRCAGGCPTGTVTHNYLNGASITLTFDGTAIAKWTGSGGRSGSVLLACQ